MHKKKPKTHTTEGEEEHLVKTKESNRDEHVRAVSPSQPKWIRVRSQWSFCVTQLWGERRDEWSPFGKTEAQSPCVTVPPLLPTHPHQAPLNCRRPPLLLFNQRVTARGLQRERANHHKEPPPWTPRLPRWRLANSEGHFELRGSSPDPTRRCCWLVAAVEVFISCPQEAFWMGDVTLKRAN